MKTLVIYDSLYGNTRAVARAIGGAIGSEVPVVSAREASVSDVESADLVIFGAPTHGSLPSEAARALLDRLGGPVGAGARAATFDTRLGWRFLRKYGYAADKIARILSEKGWTLVGMEGGFFVRGLKKGPLKKGELERATTWAQELMESLG